ncbi:MAG: DUF3572 family protein [Devosia sp.]
MALKPTRLTIPELAELCLEYLAQNPEQLAEFMIQSGIQPTDLRRLMGTHELAHGLIDYVVANEPLLVAIAGANDLKPESITQAWAMHHHHEH